VNIPAPRAQDVLAAFNKNALRYHMPFERHGPCPCGSGKNFRECHGQPGQAPPDAYRINRAIAKAGETGQFRHFFARQYAQFKQQIIEDVRRSQQDRVAAQKKEITCRQGCIHCCKLYVFTTLEEAECIVYFLYAHEDKFNDFLKNYHETWSQNKVIQRDLLMHHQLQDKIYHGEITVEEQELFDKQLNDYFEQDVRCPFLTPDDACSIYPVRPFVCAGLVATSPAENCAPGSIAKADYCRVTIRRAVNMPYFLKNQDREVFGNLPDVVHRLLAQGYGALEELTANPGLFQKAADEPEVKDILQALGASLPR
jgi:Fe-S-cluster containining protein